MTIKTQTYSVRVKVEENWLVDFGRPVTEDEAVKIIKGTSVEGDDYYVVDEDFVKLVDVVKVST